MIKIAFVNSSSVVSDAELQACVATLQMQVIQDLFPIYGVDADLDVVKEGTTPNPAAWQMVIGDTSDQLDALGYHELTAQGFPLGKVFAKSDKQDGSNWTVTASHETLEMLIDPWACLCAQGPDGTIRAYEVADAVEDDQFAYEIKGIKVSDFVTPAWFDGSPGPYDLKELTKSSGELLEGGYIAVLDPNHGWSQVMADKAKGLGREIIKSGSRRYKRALGRSNWKLSTV